jgi:hypothetical protein
LRIPLGNSALEQSGTSFEMHYKEQMGTFLWNWSDWVLQVTLVFTGVCDPANRPLYWKRVKRERYNNLNSDVKLASELFDAKLICITFTGKPRKGSTQVMGFKIWPRIRYWCSSWYWNRTIYPF